MILLEKLSLRLLLYTSIYPTHCVLCRMEQDSNLFTTYRRLSFTEISKNFILSNISAWYNGN